MNKFEVLFNGLSLMDYANKTVSPNVVEQIKSTVSNLKRRANSELTKLKLQLEKASLGQNVTEEAYRKAKLDIEIAKVDFQHKKEEQLEQTVADFNRNLTQVVKGESSADTFVLKVIAYALTLDSVLEDDPKYIAAKKTLDNLAVNSELTSITKAIKEQENVIAALETFETYIQSK